jgi:hypothetical protein
MTSTPLRLAPAGALLALVAACGSSTTAGAPTVAAAPSSQQASASPTATSTPAATAACPKEYKGQRVDLSGTINAVMPLGGNYIIVVKDSAGQTCQLITHANPGAQGASVSVHDYVAYVAPGNPPISRVAPADYPDIPK